MCVCVYVCIEMSESFWQLLLLFQTCGHHTNRFYSRSSVIVILVWKCVYVCVCVFDYVLSMVQGVLAKRCGVDWCSTGRENHRIRNSSYVFEQRGSWRFMLDLRYWKYTSRATSHRPSRPNPRHITCTRALRNRVLNNKIHHQTEPSDRDIGTAIKINAKGWRRGHALTARWWNQAKTSRCHPASIRAVSVASIPDARPVVGNGNVRSPAY